MKGTHIGWWPDATGGRRQQTKPNRAGILRRMTACSIKHTGSQAGCDWHQARRAAAAPDAGPRLVVSPVAGPQLQHERARHLQQLSGPSMFFQPGCGCKNIASHSTAPGQASRLHQASRLGRHAWRISSPPRLAGDEYFVSPHAAVHHRPAGWRGHGVVALKCGTLSSSRGAALKLHESMLLSGQ